MPRERIDTGRDTRYVRRDEGGRFDDVVEEGRSLTRDRRTKAKRTVKAGEGDKGDQKRRARAGAGRKTSSRAKAGKKGGKKKSTGRGRRAARS